VVPIRSDPDKAGLRRAAAPGILWRDNGSGAMVHGGFADGKGAGFGAAIGRFKQIFGKVHAADTLIGPQRRAGLRHDPALVGAPTRHAERFRSFRPARAWCSGTDRAGA
jgi:hypothetical protein